MYVNMTFKKSLPRSDIAFGIYIMDIKEALVLANGESLARALAIKGIRSIWHYNFKIARQNIPFPATYMRGMGL
jgi:hypothetical protein